MLPSPDLFKKLHFLQLHATRLAEDLLAGAYRSAFKGKGMEFEEVRAYQSGDDVRSIDWNVTARMHHLYVKNFREEREMTVTLAVDISASTHFGSGSHLKRDVLTEIAALLAFSAIKNHDKVALLLFSQGVERYFPPKKGSRHVLRIIRELFFYPPKHTQTDMAAALSFLGKVQQQSSICFLLSDFITSDYTKEVALLSRRHELIALAITDPHERTFPPIGLVRFKDLEEGTTKLIDASSSQTELSFDERLSSQKKLFSHYGADFLVLSTDRPYLPQLRHFFMRRQRRR